MPNVGMRVRISQSRQKVKRRPERSPILKDDAAVLSGYCAELCEVFALQSNTAVAFQVCLDLCWEDAALM